ncbi:MAG: glycosyltransferase family 2 protein [Clostridia bacterium]|nr:glycosyltransferase family 2 protein [Clostridia bacterium]
MYQYVFGIIFNILELILFIIGAYYTMTAFFSLFSAGKYAVNSNMNRFAVIIPAHNEAGVLGRLIKSIKSADYPQELIDIYVVADGCTDNTADIARAFGAVVLEKSPASCKGDALKSAFGFLKDKDFDAVIVFDADNIADKNFFKEINEEHSRGTEAVQGYIDSLNPYSSWVANAHSVWYWLTNRIMQTGRSNLNLGCRIGGTGFAISKNVLAAVPWETSTLAEDAEYTCILALLGIKVGYAKKAVVYDEKPLSFSQSVQQRKRWASGLRDVQGEYTLKLLFKGKLNAILGLWNDFLYPFIYIALLAISVFADFGIFASIPGKAVLWFYLAANIIISIIALAADKKLNYKTVLNSFGFLLYMLSWIPVGIFGIFSNSKNWHHTPHGKENRR